jgi:hypothetical protein
VNTLRLPDPSEPLPLDHAVVSVRDRMDEAEKRYARLGFTLTPRGYHSLGSINHLMVFGPDYLELIGFPPGMDNARPEIKDAPVGLNGIVLQPRSADAVQAALTAAGLPVNPVQALTRPVDLGGSQKEASFRTVRFSENPVSGGRLYFCQHLTPELVWRPEWQSHANGVTRIKYLSVVSPDPAAEAARYARVLGAEGVADRGWGWQVKLGHCAVLICTAKDFADHFPQGGVDPEGRASYMAAVTFQCGSLASAQQVIEASGITTHPGPRIGPASRYVAAPDAMNVVLEFTE